MRACFAGLKCRDDIHKGCVNAALFVLKGAVMCADWVKERRSGEATRHPDAELKFMRYDNIRAQGLSVKTHKTL